MPSLLHDVQVIVAVFAAAGTGLLAFMFWTSALTNGQVFTRKFLKFLSLCAMLRGVEIVCAIYRTIRIEAMYIPSDASVAGLFGRGVEMVGYTVMIWFLLRPETKKALNGNSPTSGTSAPMTTSRI